MTEEILVVYSKGNEYRVLIQSDNAVIASQNNKIFEDPMVVEVKKSKIDTIEYDLTDPDVCFDDEMDDHVHNSAATDGLENGSDGVDQVEVRAEQDIAAELHFETFIYNPEFRRSERHTAGQNIHRFGYATACVTIDGRDSFPHSYSDTNDRPDQ